jgi:hypothetical protein
VTSWIAAKQGEQIKSETVPMLNPCTGAWVTQWEINVPGLEMLAASCVAAAVVNLTQYMILGDFSASSYQVRQRAQKTCTFLLTTLVITLAIT